MSNHSPSFVSDAAKGVKSAMVETLRPENLLFVLVEPRNPGNVGAAARALFNMGLEHLAIVRWEEDTDARRIALEWSTDGQWVLQKARRCDSLEEAIADCHLAIATSARQGADRPPPLTLDGMIEQLRRWTSDHRVAIVFGPERTGLRYEHLRLCSHSFMIPTASAPRSFNLGQAVLLTAYEIVKAAGGTEEAAERPQRPLDQVASRGEREQLVRHATEMLKAVDFLKPGHPVRPMHDLGYMLDRAGATSHEVKILHGVCRSVLKTIRELEKKTQSAP
jgi:TrmH family RNA methyltransferase